MPFAVVKPQKRVENRDYRAFIRALPCIQCAIEGRTTFGCDPAHVSYAFPWLEPSGQGDEG
ncbi:hypothetical protein [Paraburkholderia fungorum]|uniref:hypothetical protein n=1 Tax=Paraburkholderia fungorum TaxID=134537 RepID=UPI003D6AD87C